MIIHSITLEPKDLSNGDALGTVRLALCAKAAGCLISLSGHHLDGLSILRP